MALTTVFTTIKLCNRAVKSQQFKFCLSPFFEQTFWKWSCVLWSQPYYADWIFNLWMPVFVVKSLVLTFMIKRFHGRFCFVLIQHLQLLHLATVVLAFVMTTVSGHPGHMVLKFYQTSTVSPIDLTLYKDNLSNQQVPKNHHILFDTSLLNL